MGWVALCTLLALSQGLSIFEGQISNFFPTGFSTGIILLLLFFISHSFIIKKFIMYIRQFREASCNQELTVFISSGVVWLIIFVLFLSWIIFFVFVETLALVDRAVV